MVNTAPSLGDQGVKCARIVGVDEFQALVFTFQDLKAMKRIVNQLFVHQIQKNIGPGIFLIDSTQS